jgi:hypothetical protein
VVQAEVDGKRWLVQRCWPSGGEEQSDSGEQRKRGSESEVGFSLLSTRESVRSWRMWGGGAVAV